MDSFDDVPQWAPISNNFNGWIMVGGNSEEALPMCSTFLELYGRDPDWGLDGSRPELKRHILCCQAGSGADGSMEKEDHQKEQGDGGQASAATMIETLMEVGTAS